MGVRIPVLSRFHAATRFVLLLACSLAALGYFYPRLSLQDSYLMQGLTESTAFAAYSVFHPFSDAIHYRGTTVLFGGFSVEIIEECTGLYEMLIYAAAVLAFPTTLVRKGIGIALGFPILYAVNVARIVFLLLMGRFYRETFEFMHLYFWQTTLVLMIASVWFLWVFKVGLPDRPGSSLPGSEPGG